jgi:hypothetical protein
MFKRRPCEEQHKNHAQRTPGIVDSMAREVEGGVCHEQQEDYGVAEGVGAETRISLPGAGLPRTTEPLAL